VAVIDHYDELLPKLERHIRACAKGHDPKAFVLLRSIHGADLIIPLIILYEVQHRGYAACSCPVARFTIRTPGINFVYFCF
jgi:hypothetical protein